MTMQENTCVYWPITYAVQKMRCSKMLTVHLLVYLFVLQVDSKFLIGLGGILVVSCAVLSSLGFCSWIGIPSSLIIVQVVPFLVLAVGADNIFIFVLEYQVRSVVPNFGTHY